MISANAQEQDMVVAAAVQNLYHGSTPGWPMALLLFMVVVSSAAAAVVVVVVQKLILIMLQIGGHLVEGIGRDTNCWK